MSEAAKDSRSALKVSPGLRPWVGMGFAQVYLGAVVGDCTSRRIDAGNPGAGGLTQSSACTYSWEPKGCISCPILVVEGLQVQILKLLLDNKDDNGVSDPRLLCESPARRDALSGPEP